MDQTITPVALWQARMGYTDRAACAALGMSLPAYQAIKRGADFSTGRHREPDRRTLLACAAIEAGVPPLAG